MTTENTIFLAREAAKRILLFAGDDKVIEFDGTTWTDRTGAAVADGTDLRWSGGWLTGAVTLANRLVVRTFKPGVDAATVPMLYNGGAGQPGDETWESKNYSARVFRPFRSYMLAGNLDWDGAGYPSRVQWCDAVEPGQVPTDWVPRADNFAGDVDLADTPGSIVDMAPLRDSLLILKRDAIYTCDWIGGNEVFSFRRLESSKGIHATDCAIEHKGYLWCQGIEDIFVVDGNTATSIVWGRMKKTWLADRDQDKAEYAFTALDPVNEEMLFFYTSKNAPGSYNYPDKALVFSLQNNAMFLRDYGLEMPHAKYALDLSDQASADIVFYGIDRTGLRLLDLESTPDRLGTPVSAIVERRGLFSDPGHDFVQVDRAKLHISGQSAALIFGNQVAADAAVDWRAPITVDPATDYKTDARQNGQTIAYRIEIDTVSDWQIAGLMMLVQKSGERG